MPKRQLTSEAQKDHGAETDQRIDQDDVDLRHPKFAHDERTQRQTEQQEAVPKTLALVLNYIDVLCVARFKNKSHT
jgi:hypothetical protein